MGEIHELLVLALSLVWFAGATPEKNAPKKFCMIALFYYRGRFLILQGAKFVPNPGAFQKLRGT